MMVVTKPHKLECAKSIDNFFWHNSILSYHTIPYLLAFAVGSESWENSWAGFFWLIMPTRLTWSGSHQKKKKAEAGWQKMMFLAFAYQQGKDIVFRFIIEYSSSRGLLWPLNNNNNNRSIFCLRIFERWSFVDLCWNLRLVSRVIIISWRIYFGFF
jgi:hypothetical protein